MTDAARRQRGHFVGTRAVDRTGIENHYIGKIATLDASALWNRETTRRFLGDLVNSGRQSKPSALSSHLPEQKGKCHVKAGMRSAFYVKTAPDATGHPNRDSLVTIHFALINFTLIEAVFSI